MKVSICDARGEQVATVVVNPEGEATLRGRIPGFTGEDLNHLGFVHYETDSKGSLISKVKEVAPSDSLDYVRALLDSIPPGYHLSEVQSERVEAQRLQRRKRFEEEIEMLAQEPSSADA